jgi:hypothetical protein
MKKLILVLSSMLAATSVAQAQNNAVGTRFYVQPSFVYVFPGDFENKAGAALAFGASFAGNHSVEVEGIRYETTDEKFRSLKVKFTHVLATYKYAFPLNAKTDAYVGVSAGSTQQHARISYSGGRIRGAAFTAGAQGGIEYKLSSHLSVNLGAKVLGLQETDVTTKGSIALLNAGVKFQF